VQGTTERLPLSIDEVTEQWLTSALASAADDEVVVDHVGITAIVWGTATKVLLDVKYEAGEGSFPARLCVKGGFVPELRPIMAAGYQAEARFYRDVAPKLGDGVPTAYFTGIDADSGQGIVILDDLAAAGARFCDAREPLTVDQAAAALEVLAGWHSRTDIDEPWLSGTPHYRPMVQGLLAPDHWDAHIAQTTSGPVLDVLSDRQRVARAFQALWTSEDGRPNTLIHGDANLTNVYVDADGSPRLLDWQFACRSDAYHDVALFLIGALSTDDRRAHEQALLRTYLDARGSDAESFNDAWDAYRRHPLHGAMYALTPEQMQPADIRAALADRFAQAALDFDTLGLLGS